MKKLFALLLAVLMIAAMAACGEPQTEPTPAEDPTQTTTPADYDYSNEELNLTVTLPDGWATATEEEAIATFGDAGETSHYDFTAYTQTELLTVAVGDLSALAVEDRPDEAFITQTLVGVYEQAGATMQDEGTIMLGSEEYAYITVILQDQPMTVFVNCIGDYSVSLITAHPVETTAQDMAALFGSVR